MVSHLSLYPPQPPRRPAPQPRRCPPALWSARRRSLRQRLDPPPWRQDWFAVQRLPVVRVERRCSPAAALRREDDVGRGRDADAIEQVPLLLHRDHAAVTDALLADRDHVITQNRLALVKRMPSHTYPPTAGRGAVLPL